MSSNRPKAWSFSSLECIFNLFAMQIYDILCYLCFLMPKLNYIEPDEAVKAVRSGDHIHLSSIASVPHILVEALCKRTDVEDLHFHHFHTEGPAPYASGGAFFDQGFFVGPNVRDNVGAGLADYIPVNLFETQAMYRNGALPCDVAMVQVSEPEDGMVSLGIERVLIHREQVLGTCFHAKPAALAAIGIEGDVYHFGTSFFSGFQFRRVIL